MVQCARAAPEQVRRGEEGATTHFSHLPLVVTMVLFTAHIRMSIPTLSTPIWSIYEPSKISTAAVCMYAYAYLLPSLSFPSPSPYYPFVLLLPPSCSSLISSPLCPFSIYLPTSTNSEQSMVPPTIFRPASSLSSLTWCCGVTSMSA